MIYSRFAFLLLVAVKASTETEMTALKKKHHLEGTKGEQTDTDPDTQASQPEDVAAGTASLTSLQRVVSATFSVERACNEWLDITKRWEGVNDLNMMQKVKIYTRKLQNEIQRGAKELKMVTDIASQDIAAIEHLRTECQVRIEKFPSTKVVSILKLIQVSQKADTTSSSAIAKIEMERLWQDHLALERAKTNSATEVTKKTAGSARIQSYVDPEEMVVLASIVLLILILWQISQSGSESQVPEQWERRITVSHMV